MSEQIKATTSSEIELQRIEQEYLTQASFIIVWKHTVAKSVKSCVYLWREGQERQKLHRQEAPMSSSSKTWVTPPPLGEKRLRGEGSGEAVKQSPSCSSNWRTKIHLVLQEEYWQAATGRKKVMHVQLKFHFHQSSLFFFFNSAGLWKCNS